MRIALLCGAAAIMILVPVSTGTMLAAFPAEFRLIPLWLWVVWFIASVWAVLDAPPRVESLLPLNRAHQSTRYGKFGMVLALANVVWSIAAIIYSAASDRARGVMRSIFFAPALISLPDLGFFPRRVIKF